MHWTGLALLGLVFGSLIAVPRLEAADLYGTTAATHTCNQVAYHGGYVFYELGTWETQKGSNYAFEATSDEGALTLEVWLVSDGGETLLREVDSKVAPSPIGTTNRATFRFQETNDHRSYMLVVHTDRVLQFTLTESGPLQP